MVTADGGACRIESRPTRQWRAPAFGFGFAGGAASLAVLVSLSHSGLFWNGLPFAVAAVSGVAGGVLWSVMFRRAEQGPRLALGVAAGMLIAVVSHLLSTLVIGPLSLWPEYPLSLRALWAGMCLCPISLAVFGWLTLPAGGIVGGMLALCARRRRLRTNFGDALPGPQRPVR